MPERAALLELSHNAFEDSHPGSGDRRMLKNVASKSSTIPPTFLGGFELGHGQGSKT
jgi:hypothetical protein